MGDFQAISHRFMAQLFLKVPVENKYLPAIKTNYPCMKHSETEIVKDTKNIRHQNFVEK